MFENYILRLTIVFNKIFNRNKFLEVNFWGYIFFITVEIINSTRFEHHNNCYKISWTFHEILLYKLQK